MAIERYRGRSQLICDGCSDSQERSYDADEFDVMLADAKRNGWRIQKEDGEWCHYCPECGA